MTNWTEVNDVSTAWGQKDYPVDSLITEDGEEFLLENGEIASTEGIQINWGETADKDTNWGFFGGLIRLCTEGLREDLMSEGRAEYLIYSHGGDTEIWTDTADIATNYTKINDI